MRRGPDVHWTTSKFKRLRDKVNPLREWKQFCWPFTVEHSWKDAPAGFRREFQFIWRRRFDCRPKNPITGNRSDSPAPHETGFSHCWSSEQLMAAKKIPNLTGEELGKVTITQELVRDYRLFAIPKTILTKKTANEMGEWLSAALKKGDGTFGELLREGLHYATKPGMECKTIRSDVARCRRQRLRWPEPNGSFDVEIAVAVCAEVLGAAGMRCSMRMRANSWSRSTGK
jgi:hypothetical protein